MTTRYLLNDMVLFTPTDNTLQVMNAEGGITHLNNPASRCLLLLITKQPDTVSQKELFSFVWRDQGSHLATNTLYQNISLLRRALTSSSDMLSDAILTVPRVGFRLNPNIRVKEVDNEDMAVYQKNDMYRTSSFMQKTYGLLNSGRRMTNGILLSITVTVWVIFGMSQLRHKEDSTDAYTKTTEISGCSVYFPRAFIRADSGRIKSNIEKLKPDCTQYKYLYYNERSDRGRLSLIFCKNKITETANCITKIYWNGVLRRNRRNFRYLSFSPATSASRSIISLLLWKV